MFTNPHDAQYSSNSTGVPPNQASVLQTPPKSFHTFSTGYKILDLECKRKYLPFWKLECHKVCPGMDLGPNKD